MAFTIVIVLMFGFSTVRNSSMYAASGSVGYTGGVEQIFSKIGDFLENLFVPELVYKRTN